MSDIPEDIRKKAEAVVDRGYNVGLIEAVTAALMEERDRAIYKIQTLCLDCSDRSPDFIDGTDFARDQVVQYIKQAGKYPSI